MLGCPIGMGYIENPDGITDEWINEGNYEMSVEGRMVPAKVHLVAPYDPKGERMRR
jgi:glycine cleavage system aminomethyltransferase T